MDISNAFNPTQSVSIPFGGGIYNTPLRMRISSDVIGVAQSACDANDFGQTEDYGIIIQDPNSVNEIKSLDNSFNVYPNPTRDIINIMSLDNNIIVKSLSIYNFVGQSLMHILQNKNNTLTTLDLSGFSKGLYFIKIETNEGLAIKKININ